MRWDAGSLALCKIDNNTHTRTQRHTSRGVECGGINKAQSVARVSASVTNSSAANAAPCASPSPANTLCPSLLFPHVFLPPLHHPSCRCLRHCRAYQQHNLSWRVPQPPSLSFALSLCLFLPLSLTFSSFSVCFVASVGQTLLVVVAFLTRLP